MYIYRGVGKMDVRCTVSPAEKNNYEKKMINGKSYIILNGLSPGVSVVRIV